MDLNQIAVLVRVIESGSLTRAAEILRQPKSRVSRRIAALERELGVTLIYRSTRQFSPTEAGLQLYRQCRQQVYDLEAAARSLQDDANEISGTLKITSTVDMGTVLLAPLLSELTSLYPRISPSLFLSDDIVDLVKEGIDVAIRFGYLKDTTLKARAIGSAPFILVASPAYLGRSPAIENVSDLTQHACLVLGEPNRVLSWNLKEGGQREDTAAVSPSIGSNNTRVLIDLTLAGKGVALLPEFMCADALREGRLQRVLSRHATDGFPVNFVWPATRETSPKLRAFIDLGLKRFAKYFA